MRKALKSIVLIAVIVSLVSLAVYLDVKLGFAPGDNSKLALTVPHLPSVSHSLDGGVHLFSIKNICLYLCVSSIMVWRIVLLKKLWELTS